MASLPPRTPWRVGTPTQFPQRPNPEGLLEDATDALPVRIKIVQDGALTGWDDGALGFEESTVWFSGRATSFRIAAPDILPGTYALSGIEAVTEGEALHQGLPLRHPTRDVWVQIEILDMADRILERDEARLIREIKALRAPSESLPHPGGGGQGGDPEPISQYPPLSPRPGVVQPPLVPPWFKPSAEFVAGIMIASSFAMPYGDLKAILFVVGALLLFLLLLPTPGAKQADTLRRIAAEEEAA